MTVKPIILFLLTLTTITSPASATAEPNEVMSAPQHEIGKLKFEMGPTPLPRAVSYGGIHPKYMAEIALYNDRAVNSDVILKIMEGPFAQRFSQAQRDLLAGHSGDGYRRGYGFHRTESRLDEHISVELYAVSEEDAKLMARVLLDTLIAEARKDRAEYERRLEDVRQEVEEKQTELVEKREQLKEVGPRYDASKKNIHPVVSDEEAAQLAKELIFQMDKEGKMLDIELAGIHAKLNIIEGYLHKPELDGSARERLEGMKIDLLIELGGLDEREKAVAKIRATEHQFYSLLNERDSLRTAVTGLPIVLEDRRHRIDEMTEQLARPSGRLTPPQVYENKVVLYSIYYMSRSQN